MNATVYLSPRMLRLFKNATLLTSDKLPENEIMVLNQDAIAEATSQNKTQIASDKACVRFAVKEEVLRIFLMGSNLDEPKEGGVALVSVPVSGTPTNGKNNRKIEINA